MGALKAEGKSCNHKRGRFQTKRDFNDGLVRLCGRYASLLEYCQDRSRHQKLENLYLWHEVKGVDELKTLMAKKRHDGEGTETMFEYLWD